MNRFLARLSERERRLFGATLGLVLAGMAFVLIRGALINLSDLDDRIGSLELELQNLREQYVQRDAVEEAYRAVVSQYSSGDSIEQIHDHLRREIYALTEVQLMPTENDPAPKMLLVHIPRLDEGQLSQGEGHSEYRVRVNIPQAELYFLLMFIERIENSQQMLRIDNLQIARIPGGQTVHASMEISRTVLDNPGPATLRAARSGGPT
jgi:hypothetical protein